MRKVFFIVGFFLSIISFGQNLDFIKTKVSKINQVKNYKIKVINNDYFAEVKDETADNGQRLTGYFQKNELKKIVHFIGLSNRNISVEYYFTNENLIFVLEKEYRTLGENGYLKVPLLLESNRIYFEDEKIIKQIGNFDEPRDYLRSAEEFINVLKTYKVNRKTS